MKRTPVYAALGIALSGCSHGPFAAIRENPAVANGGSELERPFGDTSNQIGTQSSLDIAYLLGHDLHRLRLEARPGTVVAQSTLGREPLIQAQINRDRYIDLFRRAAAWVDSSRRPAAAKHPAAVCRAPYSLTLQSEGRSKTLSGCRLGEEGTQISRFIRDAEFLLYSKN